MATQELKETGDRIYFAADGSWGDASGLIIVDRGIFTDGEFEDVQYEDDPYLLVNSILEGKVNERYAYELTERWEKINSHQRSL